MVAEALSLPHGDVGAEFPGGASTPSDSGSKTWIALRAPVMGGGEELADRFEHAEDVRMLHHDGGDVVGLTTGEPSNPLDVPRSPAGRAQRLDGAGIDAR